MKRVLTGCLIVVGLGFAGVGAIFGLTMRHAKNTNRDFDAFTTKHGKGTPVADLFTDPFAQELAELDCTGAFQGRAEAMIDKQEAVTKLVARFVASPAVKTGKGSLSLMWIYLPPFGRLFFAVDYEDGVIRETKISSLD